MVIYLQLDRISPCWTTLDNDHLRSPSTVSYLILNLSIGINLLNLFNSIFFEIEFIPSLLLCF